MSQQRNHQRPHGFTMIEIMVVLAIMGLLAAILFPIFSRSQENGRQKTCASNLHQIYQAVQLYYADERRYPGSLAFLLPQNVQLADDPSPTDPPNLFGTGYYTGGLAGLRCPSDRFRGDKLRSSYGDISADWELPSTGGKNAFDGTNHVETTDMGRYLWNHLGYDENGYAYFPADINTKFSACPTGTECEHLVNPEKEYDGRRNVVTYSLSNRFAPPATIITHCVNHRSFNSRLNYPGELSLGGPQAQGARDVILRLDGSAKTYDVSTFGGTVNRWQTPVS